MAVKLRKRKLRDGSEQYYFDVYHKGQREYPTFKEPQLILKLGQDKKTLKANAEVEKMAQRLLTKLQSQLDEGTYVFLSKTNVAEKVAESKSFLEYFRTEAMLRHARRGCKSNTYSCFKHFERFVKAFHGPDLLFENFTKELAKDFKAYMQRLVAANTARKEGLEQGKGPRGINSNCALIYLKRLKMVSSMAFREGKISTDAAFSIKNFDYRAPQRHFLEPHEVRRLVEDLSHNPVDGLMKRAFLFSCATGLRWEDLTGITWNDIQGTMLETEVRKSKGKKRLRFELSEFALDMAGGRGHTHERIFPLEYNMYLNVKLDRWVLSNGIQKKITWHCARHTFATALLENGQDISLVQVALAHSRIDTTMIYAKVLNKTLNQATSALGNLYTE